MNAELITITPENAKSFLEKNKIGYMGNRQLKKQRVEGIANAIARGQFVTTHQGIAFNEKGELIDGQHRLHAIVMAGISVPMWVFYDVPEKQGKIYTMDVIDRGETRAIGDQLTIRHGIKSGRRIAAVINGIAAIPTNLTTNKMTVPIAVEIYNMYKDSINFVYSLLGGIKVYGSKGMVTGALAFCHYAMPDDLNPFCQKYATGEMIKRGDPAYALRYFIANVSKYDGKRYVYPVATACMYQINQKPLYQIKSSTIGVDFFKDKQPRNVSKIRNMFGMK